MPGHRFPGGLRLDPRKIASTGELRTLPMPPRLYLPLLQHLGEPARACVAVGDAVARGQRIGEAVGLLSAHVHAPASGRVMSIRDRQIGHPSGRELPCIELLTDDGPGTACLPAWPDWQERDAIALTGRLREAGVVGLGGAVFPTDVKLTAASTPVHTLLVNGAECEPYIACDDALLRHRAAEVLGGCAVLAHLLGAPRTVLAVEDTMTVALSALSVARDHGDHAGIELTTVPTRYPQGGERQLIRTVLGPEIGAGKVPRQHGIVCINVGTAAAAWRAVARGEPLTSRLVSVTGSGVRNPCTLEVPLGAPVSALVAAAGGYTADARRLVLGGPMMGVALPHDQVPLGKSGNCVLVLAADEVRAPPARLPCIRCGECARVCPARLLPQQLHFHIQAGDWAATTALGLADCIECGLCSFVCPSAIPLVESFRHGKGELAFQAREQARAELSRQRFEARNARLERAAAERSARLQAREAALTATAAAEAPDADTAALAAAADDGDRREPDA